MILLLRLFILSLQVKQQLICDSCNRCIIVALAIVIHFLNNMNMKVNIKLNINLISLLLIFKYYCCFAYSVIIITSNFKTYCFYVKYTYFEM